MRRCKLIIRPTASSGQTGERLRTLIRKIAILQSSYTQALNNQENRSGSLFRQKTKAVELESLEYALTCFHYIHQNPLKAGLVKMMEEWEFSSFRDYCGLRSGTLINKVKASEMLELDQENFVEGSYQALDSDLVEKIIS